jgi:hypothetical protein
MSEEYRELWLGVFGVEDCIVDHGVLGTLVLKTPVLMSMGF